METPRTPSILAALASGDFLNASRVRRLAAIFLALAGLGIAALFATSDGFRDATGRALGADFMAFHAAGAVARADGADAAYNDARLHAEQQRRYGEAPAPFWPFIYPPAFLIVAILLSFAPYIAAWLLWSGATLAAYLVSIRNILRAPGTLLAALAFPAAFLTFLHGQTGFLIAALFGFGLCALGARREILAGLLLGLIAIKPQYGLLIPVALAAGGYWRAFGAAALSVAFLALAPTLAFGPEIWRAFFGVSRSAQAQILNAGGMGFEKIVSAFGQARLIGAPLAIAYGAQAMLALAAIIATARTWRRPAAFETKAALLITGAIAATPYVLDYDLVILAPAAAFLVRAALAQGFLPFEKSVLLFVAIATLAGRAIGEATHVSLGFIGVLLLYAAILRRAR